MGSGVEQIREVRSIEEMSYVEIEKRDDGWTYEYTEPDGQAAAELS